MLNDVDTQEKKRRIRTEDVAKHNAEFAHGYENHGEEFHEALNKKAEATHALDVELRNKMADIDTRHKEAEEAANKPIAKGETLDLDESLSSSAKKREDEK